MSGTNETVDQAAIDAYLDATIAANKARYNKKPDTPVEQPKPTTQATEVPKQPEHKETPLLTKINNYGTDKRADNVLDPNHSVGRLLMTIMLKGNSLNGNETNVFNDVIHAILALTKATIEQEQLIKTLIAQNTAQQVQIDSLSGGKCANCSTCTGMKTQNARTHG